MSYHTAKFNLKQYVVRMQSMADHDHHYGLGIQAFQNLKWKKQQRIIDLINRIALELQAKMTKLNLKPKNNETYKFCFLKIFSTQERLERTNSAYHRAIKLIPKLEKIKNNPYDNDVVKTAKRPR